MGWDFVVDESAFGAMFKEFAEEKKVEILKVINEEKGKSKNKYIIDHIESSIHNLEEDKIRVYEETVNEYRQTQVKLFEESQALREEKTRLEDKLHTFETEKARLEEKLRERDGVIQLKEKGEAKYREEIKGLTSKFGFMEEKLRERDAKIEEMKSVIADLQNRKTVSISFEKNHKAFEEDKQQSAVSRNLERYKAHH